MNSRPIEYLRHQAGFTMIELTIVLAVISVVVAGILPFIASTNQENAATLTLDRIEEIDAALASFVAANDRLPCPANLVLPLDDPDFGREAAAGGTPNCTGGTPAADYDFNNVVGGAVPVKDIGLPDEYAFDGYGQRISYHVHSDYTLDIDPTTPPTAPLIEVEDELGGLRTDEAVYLLLSHGPKGHGAYLRSGAHKNIGSTNLDTLENCDCDATAVDTGYNALFVQRPSAVSDDPLVHHDDIVRYKLYNQVRGAAATAEGAGTPLWVPDGNNIYAVGTDGDEATGNVGIGTDTPTELFHITGGNAVVDSGKLGVGTPGPGSSEVLSVSNVAGEGVRIGPNANDGSTGLLVTANDPGQRALIARGSAGQTAEIFSVEDSAADALLTVAADGNVGIGKPIPESELDVEGQIRTKTSISEKPDIYFAGHPGEDGGIAANQHIYFYTDADNSQTGTYFIFKTDSGESDKGSELVRITDDGKVGIGTGGGTEAPLHAEGTLGRFTDAKKLGSYPPSGESNNFQAVFRSLGGDDGGILIVVGDDNEDEKAIDIYNETFDQRVFMVQSDGAVTAKSYDNLSDRQLKENIRRIGGLEVVENLRGVSYDWKNSGEGSAGVIAQEVEKILPSAVRENTDGMKTVEYDQLIAPLIEAVKALKTQKDEEITALDDRIRALEDEPAAKVSGQGLTLTAPLVLLIATGGVVIFLAGYGFGRRRR